MEWRTFGALVATVASFSNSVVEGAAALVRDETAAAYERAEVGEDGVTVVVMVVAVWLLLSSSSSVEHCLPRSL